MKTTINYNGKDVEINLTDEQVKEIAEQLNPPKKHTGYERVDNEKYYFCDKYTTIDNRADSNTLLDNCLYNYANYYSNETVAENNKRADALIRRLRRFAVEHRENAIDWSDNNDENKYFIVFCYDSELHYLHECNVRDFGAIYFDNEDTVKLAINTFKDELLWYFKEYKDSL